MALERLQTFVRKTNKPVNQHYDIVPLERILGLCPVICFYCNLNTTIPEWVANSAEAAFPVGSKSTKTEQGSATYVIYNLGLKFSP